MSKKVKVLKFSALWCGPCKSFKPIWENVVEKNTNPDIEYVAIDIDEDDATTSKYKIRSIPTTVFLKDDVEVERVAGVIKDLQQISEKHLYST